MTTDHADDITDECADRNHDDCTGYTEPESDPETCMCMCECHDEVERRLRGEYVERESKYADELSWEELEANVTQAATLRRASDAAVVIGQQGEAVLGLQRLAEWLTAHPEAQ